MALPYPYLASLAEKLQMDADDHPPYLTKEEHSLAMLAERVCARYVESRHTAEVHGLAEASIHDRKQRCGNECYLIWSSQCPGFTYLMCWSCGRVEFHESVTG